MAQKGNNLLIFLNGTAIAGATFDDAQSGVDLLEIGSPIGSGQWKQFLTRRKYWSINVNYLVLQNTGVRNLLSVGTTYTVKFKARDSADNTGVSGQAILKVCRITAQKGNLVQGSFQFQGNGQLS